MSAPPDFIGPRHQTNWDWRAASNFMFGGAGSGLLIALALLQPEASVQWPATAAALLLIALGLFCVWLEIGRPLRSVNVLLHPSTSWMTRESMVAPLVFGFGALALWKGGAYAWPAAAAIAAAAFVYCQAQILKASRGIPAWRTPEIVPLVIATGLAEGTALLAVADALVRSFHSVLLMALVALLLARGVAWRSYRLALRAQGAPEQAFAALDAAAGRVAALGQWSPIALALVALALDGNSMAGQLTALTAGVFAVYGGWLMKFTIVTRAAFNQGFALPQIPVRGRRVAAVPSMQNAQPGWRAAEK